jgi:hypothetical protein
MEWDKLPYNHAGKWQKNIQSIFNPDSKITWVQFIMEMVVYNRTRYLKNYPVILKGPRWSHTIANQIRALSQQSSALVNYFPHIEDEPLVAVAFKNVFRNNRVIKIGQFRKARVKKTGNSNITKDEKDIILAVTKELERLIKQRDTFKNAISKSLEEKPKNIQDVKFGYRSKAIKGGLGSLIELENKLKKP